MTTFIRPNSAMTQDQLKSMLGQIIHTVDDDGLALELIVVKAGEAISNGELCTWSVTADDGYTVDLVDAVGQRVCGVAVADIASGAYGYLMKRGKHSAVLTDGSVVAKNPVCAHTNGTAKICATDDWETATSIFGFALDTDAGSPTVAACMVNCPG